MSLLAVSAASWSAGRDAASISTLMGSRRMRNVVAGQLPGAKLDQASLVKLGFDAGGATSSIQRSTQLKLWLCRRGAYTI